MSRGADPWFDRDMDGLTVEYLEPEVEAEPLPDEFSSSRLRRSLLVLGGIVLVVVAAIVLVPGLALAARPVRRRPARLARARGGPPTRVVCGYVLVFRGVFCRRMSWRTSTEIGLSELAANSVFSVGGAGGLALGAWILRRGGLPTAFIARRTVAFFLLTSLANVGVPRARRRWRSRPACWAARRASCSASSRRSPPWRAIALALAARRLAGALARRSDARAGRRRGGGRRRGRRRGARAAARARPGDR